MNTFFHDVKNFARIHRRITWNQWRAFEQPERDYFTELAKTAIRISNTPLSDKTLRKLRQINF